MFDFDLSVSTGKVRRLARRLAYLCNDNIAEFSEFGYLENTFGFKIDWLYAEPLEAKLSLFRAAEQIESLIEWLEANQRKF
jgi:hypothetical protein